LGEVKAIKAKAKKEYFTPEMEADLEFCKSNKLI
jgi:hypothetical protein